ncbi:MAG: glycoside hydrolase family 5 protein [Treponema sp.]|nr:glycoside hydrolase family 5 protein [Treponema sp.]
MKKFFVCLLLICCTMAAFAQNVKPYTVDLNNLDKTNEEKSVTFDIRTKTVTVKKNHENQAGIGIWLNKDVSSYNIIRVKYKALGDYGFHVHLSYKNDPKADYWGDSTFCPSYLTEMVIPIKDGVTNLEYLNINSVNHIHNYKFIIEKITLENVADPKKTDVWVSDEPPVIDTATSGKFNDSISSWDFVKGLGTGLNYSVFAGSCPWQELGMDFYHWDGYSKPSKKEIQFIKAKGFKGIRMITTPGAHMLDEKYTIDPRFIKAIKEVVDWCIEEDMYVIICGQAAETLQDEKFRTVAEENVHYAGYTVTEKYKKQSKEFIKAMWTQYAQAFNNSYDEHLIFETLNEPIDCFHEETWRPRQDCPECKKALSLINEYNQLIVDTIRSTGGNNAKRFIMVEGLAGGNNGYITITYKTFKLPKDKAKDKLIPTYHHYPMSCGLEYSDKLYTNAIKDVITETFATLDKLYFKKKIPVYVSEIGFDRTIPALERINCAKDFLKEATKEGRSTSIILHDDSDIECKYAGFGYYDKQNLKWMETEMIDSILYAAQGKEFPLSDAFIKKNEIKIESIVGKNLLKKPHELKDWKNDYSIDSGLLVRSVPAKYKFEFQVEKTGSKPTMQLAFNDMYLKWHEIAPMKNVRIQGGTLQDGWCIAVKSDTLTVSIDEKLAQELESGEGVYINGTDLIIKSIKVVE